MNEPICEQCKRLKPPIDTVATCYLVSPVYPPLAMCDDCKRDYMEFKLPRETFVASRSEAWESYAGA